MVEPEDQRDCAKTLSVDPGPSSFVWSSLTVFEAARRIRPVEFRISKRERVRTTEEVGWMFADRYREEEREIDCKLVLSIVRFPPREFTYSWAELKEPGKTVSPASRLLEEIFTIPDDVIFKIAWLIGGKPKGVIPLDTRLEESTEIFPPFR
jgi:hypothetical protein